VLADATPNKLARFVNLLAIITCTPSHWQTMKLRFRWRKTRIFQTQITDWLTGCLTKSMQEFPCWEPDSYSGTEGNPNDFRRVFIIAKSLLSSSSPSFYLSVRPSACDQRGSHWTLKFGMGTCMKIYRETPNLVKIVQKYRAPHMEAQVRFIESATHIHHRSIAVPRSRSLLAVTCVSTTQAERIAALPPQQWPCQHATVLCYT